MAPLKERVRLWGKCVRFIDDYRLIGTPFGTNTKALRLWDTSIQRNRGFPGLALELESQFDQFTGPYIFTYCTDHGLPFCESPYKNIAIFMADKEATADGGAVTQTFVVNLVGVLASFAPRIGTVESVPWQEWQHLVTPIPAGVHPPLFSGVFHSEVLEVHPTSDPSGTTLELRISDFSLLSRRRKVQDDPSAPLPQYTVQKFLLSEKYHHPWFNFMEGGILIESVRTHVVANLVEALIRCTSSIRRAETNDISGRFRWFTSV